MGSKSIAKLKAYRGPTQTPISIPDKGLTGMLNSQKECVQFPQCQ